MSDKENEIEIEDVEDNASNDAIVVEDQKADPVEDVVENLKRQLEAEKAARLEADRRAQTAAAEAVYARNEAEEGKLQLIEGAIETVERESALIKAEHQRALAAQDWARVSELTELMQQKTLDLQQLTNGRDALRARPKQEVKPVVHSDPVEELASRLSPKSADWVRRHPQYVTDSRLNRRMIAAHELAVTEGLQVDTPEYFAAIEETLGVSSQPRRAARVEAPDDAMSSAAHTVRRRDSAPAAAPVSRDTGSRKNVVRLSAQEREIAEMSGLTPEEYARNKLRMLNEREARG